MSEAFDKFVETVATLRGPNGCPWDKKQTHASLKPYFVEETYEALQAIDDQDDEELKSELGDVLLQIGLHAQIASENARFSMDDVCRAITEKLIRRHPHVFSDVTVSGVDEVLTNWEAIKASEKPGQTFGQSAIGEVPNSLPALLLALKVSKRAAKLGFEWQDIHGVLEKMREEISELETALSGGCAEDIENELGDLLFTIVNVARWAKVDPEESLRRMVLRFRARFSAMEQEARERGVELSSLSAQAWDDLWNLAKARVSTQPVAKGQEP